MSRIGVNKAHGDAAAGPVGPASAHAPGLDEIARRFQRAAHLGGPKYVQLRRAIADCVEDGAFAPGDQLPPDDRLTTVLGISLGTVRRALAHLAAGGIVTREHGRGTFVASHHRAISDSWHFRFLTTDRRSLLPVYSQVVDRVRITTDGPWQVALGDDPEGYVRIRRSFDVNQEFQCHSEFYLRAGRFGRMLQLPRRSLESINLKKVLNEEFGTPTIYIQQRLRAQRFDDALCDALSIPPGSHGLFLEVVAFTYDHVPVSYHEIYVPPVEYLIDLSAADPTLSSAVGSIA